MNTIKLPSEIANNYDVVIVGAGPAGCMTAYHLNPQFNCLLIDFSTLPKDKICGGVLNSYSYKFIQELNPPQDIFVKPETINFRFIDWERNIKRETSMKLVNSSRQTFNNWLLSLLPDHIHVLDKIFFKSFDFSDDEEIIVRISIKGQEKEIKTKFLVGAGGARTPVRRQLTSQIQEHYRAVHFRVEKKDEYEPFFDCILTNLVGDNHIYSYILPKKETILVGSVFFPGAKAIVEKHENLLKEFRSNIKAIGSTVKKEVATALRVRKQNDIFLGKGNVLLTGEEAGFISPTSGEGISYSLNGGTSCAQAINQSALDKSSSALTFYQDKTKSLIRNLIRKTRKLSVVEKPFFQRLFIYIPPSLLSYITKRL